MTDQIQQARRRAFEAWVVDFHRGSSLEGEIHNDERYPSLNGQWIYDDWDVQSSWWSWQASRAALCVELPKVRCYPPNEAFSDVDYWIDEARGVAVSECRSAIHAAGVKTK